MVVCRFFQLACSFNNNVLHTLVEDVNAPRNCCLRETLLSSVSTLLLCFVRFYQQLQAGTVSEFNFFIRHTRHMMPSKIPFLRKLCYLTMTSWYIPLHLMLMISSLEILIAKGVVKRATAGSCLNLMHL